MMSNESTPSSEMGIELEGEAVSRQQERLFRVTTILALVLVACFFIASIVQLAYLHQKILASPGTDLRESLSVLANNGEPTSAAIGTDPRLYSQVVLEMYVLERRYHQANVLLMSRVWVRYLGFITGMILALMGAAFILGKLREPSSKLGAELATGKFSFEGASPGMFLAGLGVILMLVTIMTHHPITVTDGPVYMNVLTGYSSQGDDLNAAPNVDDPYTVEADSSECSE